ncbi:4202_t:CDS:2, partial [Gigaspora rosea]
LNYCLEIFLDGPSIESKKEICEIDENKNVNNRPVPLILVHTRWHLKQDSIPSIPLSLSTLEVLITEEIPVPKAALHNKVINVDGNGNCRYRAVAVGLGRNENEWPNVKKELFKELNKNEQFYRSLFLANDDYDTILKEIPWESGPCTFDHWMKMPQMDDVIANAYKRPLYFFSLQISLTFLPYHHPLNRNEALAIAKIIM